MIYWRPFLSSIITYSYVSKAHLTHAVTYFFVPNTYVVSIGIALLYKTVSDVRPMLDWFCLPPSLNLI